MSNDKPMCLLVDDDYFPQELAEKLLSECLFNGDYDDFIVELFREEALQSKRDFRNGFCDAYAIPMDMLSEVVADVAHAVKFDDSFSKDDCFFTNFAEKAPAFRHEDESARQTWHFGKTLLQNDEVSGIIVASLDSPKESGCAGDEKETA